LHFSSAHKQAALFCCYTAVNKIYSAPTSPAMRFNTSQLSELEKQYRTNLINCLSGCKPVVLIGTKNNTGKTNVAVFSNIVHIGAHPPLMGFIQRPVENDSHTYKNIKETGYFTINHVHKVFLEKAHFTSARFEKEVSEFSACRLTEDYIDGFHSPFVKESRVKAGLKFVKEIPIEINNTILIIGQVEQLLVDDEALLLDGNIDLSLTENVCAGGLENYYEIRARRQFPYAKKEMLPNFS